MEELKARKFQLGDILHSMTKLLYQINFNVPGFNLDNTGLKKLTEKSVHHLFFFFFFFFFLNKIYIILGVIDLVRTQTFPKN